MVASLVMQQGHRMQLVVKQHVFEVPEASKGDEAGLGGVPRVQVRYFVASKLWAVVQKRAEEGIWLLSIDTLLMMWHAAWMCVVFLWGHHA